MPADFYIESDAEEIYMPEKDGGYGSYGATGGASLQQSGIVGYQKYLHIISRLA